MHPWCIVGVNDHRCSVCTLGALLGVNDHRCSVCTVRVSV